jgi:secreted trypsin-like serine protease
MRRALFALIASLTMLVTMARPTLAITGGQLDNGAHPQVGSIIAPVGDGTAYFCSGTLIAPTVVLTAAHCTSEFSALGITEILVSFDDSIDFDNGTFYLSHDWASHPGYDDASWPFTMDVGVVLLDEAVDLPLASLPDPGLLDTIIPEHGSSPQRFNDVGYGVAGVITGGGPPQVNFPLDRRVSTQRYAPGGNDMVGVIHGITDLLFMLKSSPSARHGGGCGGDSGGPIFLEDTYTIVAIHIGGYRLGYDGALCGRLSSINFRIDNPDALNWLYGYL